MILTTVTSLFSFLFVSQIALTPLDPALNFRTKQTEHFYIHYSPDLEPVAARLSQICEPIYKTLTAQLKHQPPGRTHIVLLNNTDEANGFSTPLPYNSMYLNIAPPSEGSSLDHYDDWLVTLFSHEFTHTIHIDEAEGVNRFLRYIFGKFWVPNAPEPQWIIEGYAVFDESKHTNGGRLKSSYLDMAIRTASLEDNFVPIEQATYWNNEYPYGQSAYWYGAGFVQYLAKKYGEESLWDFGLENASWPIIGWFNLKTRNIFGKSFSRLWHEWQEEESQYWKSQIGKYQTHYKASKLENWMLGGQGVWEPGTNHIYAPLRREGESILAKISFNPDSKENYQIEKLQDFDGAKRLSLFNNRLYYAQTKKSVFNSYSEIVALDLQEADKIPEGQDKSVSTYEAQLKDPFVSASGIYAVQTKALKSKIIWLPDLPHKQSELTKDWVSKNAKVIFEAPGFSAIHSPTLSPNGQSLAFSMMIEGESRDLYVLDLRTKNLQRITQDYYEEYFPSFSPDGNYLIFSSDHYLGGTQSKVFNIYAVHLVSRRLHQLTDSWAGVYWPVWFNNQLVVGNYTSKDPGGFEANYLKANLPSSQSSILEMQTVKSTPAPIVAKASETKVEDKSYQRGYSLLPHYLAPVWFVTEDDSAFGAFTGSNDPLGYHRWTLFGAYLSSPARPIGSLSYSYLGLAPVNLNFGASAGITDYGRILIRLNSNNQLYIDPDRYYERTYYLTMGASSRWYTDGRPSNWSLGGNLFFEKRAPLFSLPSNLITGISGETNVVTVPEKGERLGARLLLAYREGSEPSFYSFSQESSTSASLEVEYSPKIGFSDFDQLISVLDTSYFWEFINDHFLGMHFVAGNQWKDVLYQKTFLLGGSFGSSAFTQLTRRSYALRGFDVSEFRGEGILLANLEYRFPLIKHLPGAGTAPAWIRNIHGALFSDAGQTFQLQDDENAIQFYGSYIGPKNPALNRFNWSTGVELKTDVSLFYGPAITYRLGYAQVIYRTRPASGGIRPAEKKEWVLSDNIHQIYFQIGQSF